MLSWNPLNPHVLLSSSTDVKTFWNKKKTFKLEIIFLNKSSTKKNRKKNLIPLPVQLSSVCGAPYQRKIVLHCNEGGVHQFVSWGVGAVGGVSGSLPTPTFSPRDLYPEFLLLPQHRQKNPKYLRKFWKKNVYSSVELIVTWGHRFLFGSQFLAEIGNTQKKLTHFRSLFLLPDGFSKKILQKKDYILSCSTEYKRTHKLVSA